MKSVAIRIVKTEKDDIKNRAGKHGKSVSRFVADKAISRASLFAEEYDDPAETLSFIRKLKDGEVVSKILSDIENFIDIRLTDSE